MNPIKFSDLIFSASLADFLSFSAVKLFSFHLNRRSNPAYLRQ